MLEFLGQIDRTVLELGSVHERKVWSLLSLEDLEGRKPAGAPPLDGRLRRRQKWESCAWPPFGSLGMHLCPVADTHAQAS